MPLVGLKEAARLTGKNQSTIHRAMKSGKLSYTISDSGERMIDPAELDRVFAVSPHANDASNDASEVASKAPQLVELRMQLEAERGKLGLMQERLTDKDAMIAELRNDRDHWRKQAETLLLTDGRERPRRSWWSFGKR
jgi:hypothetical protein